MNTTGKPNGVGSARSVRVGSEKSSATRHGRRRSAKVLSLTAVVAAAAAVALAAWLLPDMSAVHAGGGVGEGGGYTPPPWPEVDPCQLMGSARRWESSRPVGPYGEVNLRTGRVLTTLPIVGWSGKGPSVGFALHHNMTSAWGQPDGYIIEEIEEEPEEGGSQGPLLGDANEDGEVTTGDIDPFIDIILEEAPTETEVQRCDFDGDQVVDEGDLDQLVTLLLRTGEPMWTHTYWRHLEFSGCGLTTNQVALVWDDAARDVFTWNETTQTYTAPPGVFLKLEPVYDNQTLTGYLITAKSQDQMWFDPTGRLEWLADAAGNQVACTYIVDPNDPAFGKLDAVTDASGRVLDLTYNASGKLKQVTDAIDRHWLLLYADPNDPEVPPNGEYTGPFVALDDPMAYRIKWEYAESDWSIVKIYDKEGSTVRTTPPEQAHAEYWHEFTYVNGRLRKVTDPDPDGEGGLDPRWQRFWYYKTTMGNWQSKYVDRRLSQWWVHFEDDTCNLDWWKDPLGHKQRLAYEDSRPALAHEPTTYTNALSKEWTTSYDDRANVLTVTDPLQHRTTMTYGSTPPDPRKENNLLSVTPPGSTPLSGNTAKQVQYAYTDASDPTSVTQIIQPADGQGNGVATVTMLYYGPSENTPYGDGAWNALLKKVTDANGVDTTFTYDQYGHLHSTAEGTAAPNGGPTKQVFIDAWEMDPLGRPRFIPRYQASGESTRSCQAGTCLDWDSAGNLSAACCCCPWWCALGPCFPELLGCNTGAMDGAPGGEAEPRSWGFPCGGAQSFGQMSGPAEFGYDHVSRLTGASSSFDDTSVPLEEVYPNWPRTFHTNAARIFDERGQLVSSSHTTDEPTYWSGSPFEGQLISRGFAYTHNDATGVYTRTGPDGQVTTTVTDSAGRVTSVTRTGTTGSMSASYTYNTDNSVATITYGNGTKTLYTYNDSGQVTAIRHEKADQTTILQLAYGYTPDGLIQTITDVGDPGGMATTYFTYDYRNRLVDESRDGGANPYALSYTYDQGGNRKRKIDGFGNTRTEYHYDTDTDLMDTDGDGIPDMVPANFYQTKMNRLMYYEVFNSAEPESGDVVQRVQYYYEDTGDGAGNPTLVVYESINAETQQPTGYAGVFLTYNRKGELWFVTEQTWPVDEYGNPDCGLQQVQRIMEFRGDGRARYAVRQRDVNDARFILTDPTPLWSDYDGDVIYGDYTVDASTGNVVDKTAYLPGIGRMDRETGAVTYYHADHLGTLRATTDGSALISSRLILTAFGETVAASGTTGTRYQYAGDSGYESGLGSPGAGGSTGQSALPWQHVGHRWYDPSSGRFLQRDPIGIRGGLNAYRYVGNLPTGAIDPLGLWSLLKWLYTGEGNASDEAYQAATGAAGELLYEKCPIRGGYARVGAGKNRGPQAGVEGRWTMDEGASVCASLGWQWSRRMGDPLTGRFTSGTGGVGGSYGWSERDGWGGGVDIGFGQNQKGRGVTGGVNSGELIDIGFEGGFLGGGIVVRIP